MRRRLRRNQAGAPRVKEVAFRPDAPGAREATEFYWGIPAKRRFEWDDPVMFARNADLVQIGKLLEFKVSNKPQGGPERSIKVGADSRLVYDRKAKKQRMYALLTRTAMRKMAALFRRLRSAGSPEYRLSEVSRAAGGHHARDRWPDGARKVIPIGWIGHADYHAKKNGDDVELLPNGRIQGPGSGYTHKLSEESGGPRPILAVDASGRLWICGGVYHVTPSGVAD